MTNLGPGMPRREFLSRGAKLAATAAALGTSVVFGVFPALQASRTDVRAMLTETGGAAIAQYAILVVGLVMVLIGVFVMIANSKVT